MFKLKRDYKDLLAGVKDIKRDYRYKNNNMVSDEGSIISEELLICVLVSTYLILTIIGLNISFNYDVNSTVGLLVGVSAIMFLPLLFLGGVVFVIWYIILKHRNRLGMFKEYVLYNTLLENKYTGDVLTMHELLDDGYTQFKYLGKYKGYQFSISKYYQLILEDYKVIDDSLDFYLALDSKGLYRSIHQFLKHQKVLEGLFESNIERESMVLGVSEGLDLKEKQNKVHRYLSNR